MFFFNKNYKIGDLSFSLKATIPFETELLDKKFVVKHYPKTDFEIIFHFLPPKDYSNLISEIRDINDQCFLSKEKNVFVRKNIHNKTIDIYSDQQYYNQNGLIFRFEDFIRANLPFLVGQISISLNKALLHGAGLIRNGKAYIFLGRDNGGKTTIIKANSKYRILNDDQIFYSIEKNNVIAHSTPFGTIQEVGLSAPVAAFFVIVKSDSFSINTGDNKQLIASFWQDNAEMLNSLPKQYRIQAFQVLSTISLCAPAFELKSNYGHFDWDIIDEAIERLKK